MRRKSGKPKSQTPGSSKGWNCQREQGASFMAKRNRSHKHKGYSEWSARHRGGKTPYAK